MQISQDIKVYFQDGIVPSNHLEFTNGVDKVNIINDVPCLFDCFIPKKNWNKISDKLLECIVTENTTLDYLGVIGILNVPSEVTKVYQELGVSSLVNMQEVKNIKQNPLYQKSRLDVLSFLEKYFLSKEYYFYHDVLVSRKGLECVTFDIAANCYTGLHIDNFDRLEYVDKELSRNRFCINLGSDPRYFLFVNLSIKKILNELNIAGFNLEDYYHNKRNPVEDFFNLFPDYPIFRIKLLPNQAYIAPTELIIHDGSSIGQSISDVTVTVRGYFNYCEK